MKLIILISLVISLQAKVCDKYFYKAMLDSKQSYLKGAGVSVKTLYAVRANTALNIFKDCADVNDYSVKYRRQLYDSIKNK